MKDNLIYSEGDDIYLDSLMPQMAFAKSRGAELMEEKGLIAEKTETSWKVSSWNFIDTKINESSENSDNETSPALAAMNETVLYHGKAFAGSTLKNIFESNDQYKINRAVSCVCTIYEKLMDNSIAVVPLGAGGIFVADDFSKVLFMPHDVFKTAASCGGDVSLSVQHGVYCNEALSGNPSVAFTEAVFVYRALTDVLPFDNTSSSQREEDIFDNNYIPLRNKVWGLDSLLSSFVDNALCRKPEIKNHSDKKKKKSGNFGEKITSSIQESRLQSDESRKINVRIGMKLPLEVLNQELGLNGDGSASAEGKLLDVRRNSKVNLETFEKNVEKENLHFAKKLKKRRSIRKHRSVIIAVAAVCAGLGFFIGIYADGNSSNPTTKGMTSVQVVSMFYSAMNTMDVAQAQSCAKGRSVSGLVDMISNFYVSSKARSMYEQKYSTVAPACWLNWNSQQNYSIYGLTQFTVDGNVESIFLEGPAKKSKVKAIKTEDGTELCDGDVKSHIVHYYFVYNEGDMSLNVIEYTDVVTLKFCGSKWKITNVERTQSDGGENFAQFKQKYAQYFEETNENILKTAQKLRSEYNWLSTDQEVLEGSDWLNKHFGLL